MPHFITETCVSCGLCSSDCPADAIDIKSQSISSNCIHCNHCVAVCPHKAMVINEETPESLEPHNISFDQFHSLTKHARSTRSFKNESIDQETLNKLLDILAQAPSGANMRNVELSFYTKVEQVKEINDRTMTVVANLFKKAASPLVNPILGLFKGKEMATKMKKYNKGFQDRIVNAPDSICYNAPAVVVLHGNKEGVGLNYADAQMWVAYLNLAAQSLGLGTCYLGFVVTALKKDSSFKASIKIPADHDIHAVLILGKPKLKYKNETQREAPKASFH